MQILSGLFPGGVLQRTAADVSDVPFNGKCMARGPVLARVTRDGVVVPGFDGLVVGDAEKRAFSGRLTGLPVGGPYTIELSVGNERLAIEDVLVGDVWILAGQSNMQGCGGVDEYAPSHPLVRAWYMDDRWRIAHDPIHTMYAAVDQVHIDLCGGVRPAKNLKRGAGPGVSFGVEMQRLTGVPQGVIACGHGGTSMAQWDPKLKHLGSRSLYGAMLRRVHKLGGQVAGLVWYQGCSDANPKAASVYTQAMQAFVRSVRRDLKYPGLPVAMVQIATVYNQAPDSNPQWNVIQEQQRLMPRAIANLTVVPAIDLTLSDMIHITGKDQVRLGKRLAAAMYGLKTGAPVLPITPKSVKLAHSHWEGMNVVITFDHVVGELQASGRPWGFSLVLDGKDYFIHNVRLEGKRAILRTTINWTDIDNAVLYYGRGCSPYCNITDAADRAVPVFGPIKIGKSRALTNFASTLRVSEPLPLPGKIADLPCPKADALTLRPRDCEGNFCDVHQDAGRAQTPQVQYFACRLRCDEPMKLKMLLGYDGPVIAWVDGAKVFCDPRGTNPAFPDKGQARLDLAAGEHEVLIALGLNAEKAWGIFLRFERVGAPKRLLENGSVALPLLLG